ncbi:hypothetical protein niasHS_012395 [Heterodera schachtii]|uniref:Uncharacterized protein n=1 Tax=Heterodera schachtii TaxID=97005 RepID=A0ABD2IRS6_HETSC
MGPASVFPCALCRIPYRALGDSIVGPRTAKSIVAGAALFSYRTADTGKHTTRDSISCGSQKALPLFFVPPTNVIPSPFHTLHSAGHFAKRWGWFAWISEQGIEHLHHVLNKQSERFMRYKGDELLLKIGEHQTLLNSIFDRQIGFL